MKKRKILTFDNIFYTAIIVFAISCISYGVTHPSTLDTLKKDNIKLENQILKLKLKKLRRESLEQHLKNKQNEPSK